MEWAIHIPLFHSTTFSLLNFFQHKFNNFEYMFFTNKEELDFVERGKFIMLHLEMNMAHG